MTNPNDCWATPHDWYDRIWRAWLTEPPNIDVCADATNTKCPLYFTEAQDALSLDWVAEAERLGVRPLFWMNPPYSEPLITDFISKAVQQSAHGGTTVFLLPNWTQNRWYHNYIKLVDHEFTLGRIKHIPPPGVKPSSPRYGSIHGVI